MQKHPDSPVDLEAVREVTDSLQCAFEKRLMISDLKRISSERPDDFGFESIEEAQEAIKEFHAEDDRRSRVTSLSDALVQMHLDDFFARCAPNSQEKERSLVFWFVIVLMESGRFDRVSSLIRDVAHCGVAEAIKRSSRSSMALGTIIGKSAKVESGGVFGHILVGVWGAVEIIVILLMIGAVDPGFQTLVIGSLVLLYATFSFAITSVGRGNGLTAFDLSVGLLRIRSLLKDRFADTDLMIEGQDNLAKAIEKAEVRHRIYIAKVAMIELIGIVGILRTVFRGW